MAEEVAAATQKLNGDASEMNGIEDNDMADDKNVKASTGNVHADNGQKVKAGELDASNDSTFPGVMDVDPGAANNTVENEKSKEEKNSSERRSPRGVKRRANSVLSNKSEEDDLTAFEDTGDANTSKRLSEIIDKMEVQFRKSDAAMPTPKKVRRKDSSPSRQPIATPLVDAVSRPSSGLSQKSEDHMGGTSISSEVTSPATSSPIPGRGNRKSTMDLSNPLFRVPLEQGWKRELVYRSALDPHSRRTGDIYYYTPAGLKLRSSREVGEHLIGTGLTLDNFSFFKEPLGINDPEKEVIRDAKVMKNSPLSSSTPTWSPSPATTTPRQEGKRTPKPKPPKGASPERIYQSPKTLLTPKTKQPKLQVQALLGTTKGLDSIPKADTPGRGKAAKKQAVTVNSNAEKLPRLSSQTDRGTHVVLVRSSEGYYGVRSQPSIKSVGQVQKKMWPAEEGIGLPQCSMKCPGSKGKVPNLQCSVCLCLFHPSCTGINIRATTGFTCKSCLAKASGATITPPPPPLTFMSTAKPKQRMTGTIPEPPVLKTMPRTDTPDSTRQRIIMMQGNTISGRSDLMRQAQSISVIDGKRFIIVPRGMIRTSVSKAALPKKAECAPNIESPEKPININCNIEAEASVKNDQALDTKDEPVVQVEDVKIKNDNKELSEDSFEDSNSSDNSSTKSVKSRDTATRNSGRHKATDSSKDISDSSEIDTPKKNTSSRSRSETPKNGNKVDTPKVNSSKGKSETPKESTKTTLKTKPETPKPSSKKDTPKSKMDSSKKVDTPKSKGGKAPKSTNAKSDEDLFLKFYNVSEKMGYQSVEKIFQYLKMRELATAARVCTLWRRLVEHPSLWKHVRMKNSQVNSWKSLCAVLKRHGTVKLDLRKMLLPQNIQHDERFWKEFCANIIDVDTLERLELCRCPAWVVEEICRAAMRLKVFNALSLQCEKFDPTQLHRLQHLEELRLKSQSGFSLTSDLRPLSSLTRLKHLSLTSIKDLGSAHCESIGSLKELETVELGECSVLPTDFGTVLTKLPHLKRLRFERGASLADADSGARLLRTLATIPTLSQLELVNFDVKPDFDDALAECTNLRRLLLIPTYVSQSATTNKQVLSGLLRLKDTLTHLMWGVTVELLRVTELFIDQCEQNAEKKNKINNQGDCIPVLKPVPGFNKMNCNEEGVHFDGTPSVPGPPQVEILPLPVLQKLLMQSLPNTKLKVLKTPFHATWRQSLSDFY